MFKNKIQRFSIRKCTWGVISGCIAAFFIGMSTNNEVHADTASTVQETAINKTASQTDASVKAPQKVEEAKANVSQKQNATGDQAKKDANMAANTQAKSTKANDDNRVIIKDGKLWRGNETPAGKGAVVYAPVINKNKNQQIAMYDKDGNLTGKYINTDSNWKVLAINTINGMTMYRLGTENQWVPAKYLIEKEYTLSQSKQWVAYIPANRGLTQVPLVDEQEM